MDLFDYQKQPSSNWGLWQVIGGRGTGKTTGLQIAAAQRAQAGERVVYVNPWQKPVRIVSDIAMNALRVGITADQFVVHAATGELRFPSGGVVIGMTPGGARAIGGMREVDTVMYDDLLPRELDDNPRRTRMIQDFIRVLNHQARPKRIAEAITAATSTGTPVSAHEDIPEVGA